MNDVEGLEQIQLPFERNVLGSEPEVLDLFCGIGGMSLGFKNAKFSVTGVDSEKISGRTFEFNSIGGHLVSDLKEELVIRDVPIVVGGPPCRPWSAVNVQRRGVKHDDHVLLERFFLHLKEIKPEAFLMENVPPIAGDADFLRLLDELRRMNYSVKPRLVRYSHFGAATTRRRLFTVGFKNSAASSAEEFFVRLKRRRRQHETVAQAIGWLEGIPRGSVPDHDWSELRTIDRYAEHYRSGKFGWKKLEWEKAAPSFGSIAKTYILHPSSGSDGVPSRVLSVREVLSIMGFSREFRFPPGTPLSKRYHMVANAVSPIAAQECALVLKEMLSGDPVPAPEGPASGSSSQ